MKNLIDDLKSNRFKQLYYIYGKDVVYIERIVDFAVKRIVPSDNDFNIYKFEGKDLNVDEFADVSEACPMFADHKCILVKDFNCEDFSTDFIKQLTSILDNIPTSSTIIFYVLSFDVKNDRNVISAKNRKLIDYVAKRGEVFEAVQKSLPQTTREIQKVCKANGSMVSYENAQVIANKCLCDSLTIRNELRKVLAYADGREITLSMIDELVSDYYNANAFNFARAVVSMNAQLSFKLLNELYILRAEPIAVLSVVASSFLDLYRVKTALITNRTEQNILNDYDYKRREFIIRNYVMDCQRIRIEHIRDCIDVLKKTNLKIVTTSTDGKILLEQAVAEMISSGYKYR